MEKMQKKGKAVKHLLSGLAGLMLILMMMGCGQMTPEKVLARATAKSISKEAGDFRSDMTLNMDMQVASQKISMDMNAVSEQTADPQNIHVNASLDMGRYGKENTEMYILSEDERYVAYLNDGSKWTKLYMDAEQRESKLDELNGFINEGFTNYVSGLVNLTMTEEEMEGKTAYRIDSTVTADAIADAMKESMESLGIDADKVDISKLGSVGYTVWVDKKTYLPIRLDMDMTELMSAVMEEAVKGSASQGQVKVTEMVLSVKYYDFGQVGTIEPSEEAASARMQ